MLGDLRVNSDAWFVEEGRLGLRPSENKRLVCFLVDAWRGWLKSVVRPSLLIVMLKVLRAANSEPSRGRVSGLFVLEEYESDVGAGVNDGDFDDDSAHQPQRRITLSVRCIVSRYGNIGSQICEKVVRCDRIE